VVEEVDSGSNYNQFKAAQLERCAPEGQPGCWKFVRVGKATDRVCSVDPPSDEFVEYGKTITVTTLPVPDGLNCADYQAGLGTPTPEPGG
jgi:hypothetical protein